MNINRFIFKMMSLFIFLISFTIFTGYKSYAVSRIVNKVEITSVSGLRLIKQNSSSVEGKSIYKLIDIPNNINILDIKLVSKSNSYRFSEDTRVLIDSSGIPVSDLGEDSYTLVLNTKELGQIYKIITKSEQGYNVLDIKVTYDNYKNTLDIQNPNISFSNSEATIFKNDAKIGGAKLNEDGKANIYINDISNLTTSTYTILIKKGSEIIGIDAFHMNPTYRELNIKDNIKFNIISQISNKLNILINPESGISSNDKVYVVNVYEESNPNENLLLNLDYTQNEVSNLQGEILLKHTLNQSKKYKVRLNVNGVDLDTQDDCPIHIKDLDISKIKVTAIEKIGKELRIDLSGINNLTKDDLIEVVSLHDIKNKEENLVSPTKLTNKVNTVEVLGKIDASNSYELVLKINNFVINGFGVEIIPVDLSNAIALTDVISNKIFISLEHSKGLKITDTIKVIGVYKDGGDGKNLLKSNYNTTIDKLNGSVFINQTLDTKGNYFIKFKINDIELENVLNITVNNNISFKGASAKSRISSHEVEVCFKNIDCISNYDQIEVDSVFTLNDQNFNLLDKEKGVKLLSKKGIVYLKGAIIENNDYGMRVKINGVHFDEIIKINIDQSNNLNRASGYINDDKKLVVDVKDIPLDNEDMFEISSIKIKGSDDELLTSPINEILLNENKEIIFPISIDLDDDNVYLIILNVNKEHKNDKYVLEFRLRDEDSKDEGSKDEDLKGEDSKNEEKSESLEPKDDDEEEKHIVDMKDIEFGDTTIKFKYDIDKKFKICDDSCCIPNVGVKGEDGYIIVNKLVPYKVYKDLKLEFKNDAGDIYSLYLPEFKCKESNDEIKNFISHTYININNGIDKNENGLEFPTEGEFWFWYNKVMKKEVDLRNFVLGILKEKEFSKKYVDNSEKIKILYRVIFGNTPSDQNLNIWLNDLNKTLKNEEMNKALRTVVEKMFTNVNFKSLEKQLKDDPKHDVKDEIKREVKEK